MNFSEPWKSGADFFQGLENKNAEVDRKRKTEK
jgi:hypothetical protein